MIESVNFHFADLTEDDSNDVEVVSSDTLIGVDPEDEESPSPKIEEDRYTRSSLLRNTRTSKITYLNSLIFGP